MEFLVEHAREFGIELTPAQLEQFETYYREMTAWNERVNLTSITERNQVMLKHFLDSLSVKLAFGDIIPRSMIDVATGAGFPGLPLKIVYPAMRVTLVEGTGKKVKFLEHVIAQLNLRDATPIHSRAEDLANDPKHREKYDVAVARAVAGMATLVEYTLPFVRVGGIFVAQKGVAIDEEMQTAARAIRVLGGRVRSIIPVQLPELEQRHLVVVEKISKTPPQYPRRAGLPKQEPLA
jgi:16S rRNA (guanine527-N7)-methyltransferase